MEHAASQGLYPPRAMVHRRTASSGVWNRLSIHLAKTRCRLLHRSISHPVNGKYRCWTCLSEFDTNW